MTDTATRNRRAGAKWEADLLKNLREEGFEVERLRLAGREDEGGWSALEDDADLVAGRRGADRDADEGAGVGHVRGGRRADGREGGDGAGCGGDDKVARVLREQQVDAQRLIEAVQAALEVDGERLLDAEERMVIELQMQELSELLKGTDGYAIEQQTKRLSQVTDAFAARRMDLTVKAALSGRNLNEIEE